MTVRNLPARPMLARSVAAATLLAVAALAAAPAHADPYGRYRGGHHHHRHGGPGWIPVLGAVVLGVAAANLVAAQNAPQNAPQTIVLPPAPPPPALQPLAVVPAVPAPVTVVTPAPVGATPAEWIVYPRHGQPPAQVEADRLGCQQWAVTVPGAWGNPSVLRRAEAACLDGRGYTVR
ncbi:MAG: hypothetical protein ACOYLV_13605 [Rubrivivax sp.]